SVATRTAPSYSFRMACSAAVVSRDFPRRGDLYRQPLAPSVFAISHRGDLVPQFAVDRAVEHMRGRSHLPFSDMDHHLGIASDVLDPCGGFACFGKQIKAVAADNKPNLDLAPQASFPPDRGQIKKFLLRKFLDTR